MWYEKCELSEVLWPEKEEKRACDLCNFSPDDHPECCGAEVFYVDWEERKICDCKSTCVCRTCEQINNLECVVCYTLHICDKCKVTLHTQPYSCNTCDNFAKKSPNIEYASYICMFKEMVEMFWEIMEKKDKDVCEIDVLQAVLNIDCWNEMSECDKFFETYYYVGHYIKEKEYDDAFVQAMKTLAGYKIQNLKRESQAKNK